jgi:asparagine synthetase B (glutamine-hydrolysing)
MCGIAGFVGGFMPGLAVEMNAAQAHRGPDGRDIFEDPKANVALGHVRLAILVDCSLFWNTCSTCNINRWKQIWRS